jgi:hypothetical protein
MTMGRLPYCAGGSDMLRIPAGIEKRSKAAVWKPYASIFQAFQGR